MNKIIAIPRVVRTWALLLSVPLYLGTATLWLKEEIKTVVSNRKVNLISSMKEQAQKSLADKRMKQRTYLLP